jgi:hypothetical protein
LCDPLGLLAHLGAQLRRGNHVDLVAETENPSPHLLDPVETELQLEPSIFDRVEPLATVPHLLLDFRCQSAREPQYDVHRGGSSLDEPRLAQVSLQVEPDRDRISMRKKLRVPDPRGPENTHSAVGTLGAAGRSASPSPSGAGATDLQNPSEADRTLRREDGPDFSIPAAAWSLARIFPSEHAPKQHVSEANRPSSVVGACCCCGST